MHRGILVSAMLLSAPIAAQTRTFPTKIEAPKYTGYFDAVANGQRIQLERQIAGISIAGAYSSKDTGTWEVQGGKSPVQFRQTDDILFVTQRVGDGTNPDDAIKLLRLDSYKKSRNLTYLTTARDWNPFKSKKKGGVPVALEFHDSGRATVMRPIAMMEPGEYAFVHNMTFFLFGID